MPASYSIQVLRNHRQLPPAKGLTRLAIVEYLAALPYSTRRHFIHRVRRLSQFMKYGRDHWPRAMDQFLGMGYDSAVKTLQECHDWQKARGDSKHADIQSFALVRFTRALRRKGHLTWELQHVRTTLMEARWIGCEPALREHIDEYIRAQRIRKLAPRTLHTLQFFLLRFACYLKAEQISYTKFTYPDALSWMEGVLKATQNAHTINHSLSVVKRFYEWLRLRRIIGESPIESFRRVQVVQKLPKILSESEAVRLVRSGKSLRDKAILEVFYASGCRLSELCRLDLRDVVFAERTAKVMGKGSRERMLFLNRSAVTALRAYLPWRASQLEHTRQPEQPSLFITRSGNRMQPQPTRVLLKQAGRIAGIDKVLAPHLLRHTFASHMLNRGADLFSIMQFMGHKKIETTARYLHVATSRLTEVHRKFHPRR